MNNKKGTLVTVINLAVGVAVLVMVVMLLRGGEAPAPDAAEKFRRLAALYESNELPGAAAYTYERYLDSASLAPRDEAQVHYVLGNIYFDKIQNFESALAHYLAAEDLDPEAAWKTELKKKIVTCFERLGRPRDAQNRLDSSTALVEKPEAEQSPLLAVVGRHEIRMSDLEDSVAAMSPEMRERLKGPEGVRPILDQAVREWLLYDLAVRKGLDNDPAVNEQMQRGRRMFLANLAYQIEMEARVKVSEEEVKKFYDENPDQFKTEDGETVPFEKVKDRILGYLKSEKARQLDGQLMGELEKLEEVKVYQDALPKKQ